MIFSALDLSFSSTGGVSVPAGWGGRARLIERMNIGEHGVRADSPLALAGRRKRLVDDIVTWLAWCAGTISPDALTVWFELAPMRGAFNSHLLHGIAVSLADRLWTYGVDLTPVPQSAARATILGYLPPGSDRKVLAVAMAYRVTGGKLSPLKSDDEGDAFVTLNYGLSSVGEYCFVAPQQKPERRRA